MKRANAIKIAVVVLAALIVTAAQSQEPMVPESVAPRSGGFGLLLPDDTTPAWQLPPAQRHDEFATDIVSGLYLRQTRDITKQDLFGRGIPDIPLGYLLRHQEVTELSAASTGKTRFKYTSQLQQDMDAVRRVRAENAYRGWGLEQLLGGGKSAFTLGFNQGRREVRGMDSQEVEVYREQGFSLAGSAGRVGPIKASYSSSQLVEIRDMLALREHEGGLLDAPERMRRTYKSDIVLPIGIRGGTLQAEYHRQAAVVGGVESGVRTEILRTPLAFWSKSASLSWQRTVKFQANTPTEQRVTTAVLPLRISNRQIGSQFTETAAKSPSGMTLTRAWVWHVPFEKQQVTLGYTTVQPFTATRDRGPRQRIETLQVPMLTLFTPRIKAAFSQTRTETVGGSTVRNTTWRTELTPTKKIKVATQVNEVDQGEGKVARTTDIRADVPVGERLALNLRYLEKQQVGISPVIGRTVALRHQRQKPAPIQLEVAYTSYETPESQPMDPALTAKLSVGKPDTTLVTATLAEFDQGSLTRYPEEVLDLSVKRHLTSSLGIEYRYFDQPGRPGPLRTVALAGSIGDNKVRVAATTYPPNPRNPREIRPADHYEAEVQRNIGTVALTLGFRHCEYRTDPEDADNFLKVGLAGGKPEGGGQLSLTYMTGDFVPPPSGQPIPGSLLELKYNKRFGDATELSLSLRRTTPPWDTYDGDPYMEGRLEVKALW